MKKRTLIFLSLTLIVITAVISLCACVSQAKGEYGETDPFKDLGAPQAQAAINLNYNDSMTASDLLEIGYRNYYAMGYVVTVNYGFNATKPSNGGLTLNGQYIDGYKIRKGAYDPNNILSADYYHLSKSGGSVKSTWEEGLIVNGNISHRITDSDNLSFSSEEAMVKVNSLDSSKFTIKPYSELYPDPADAHSAYNTEVCNDPTKILMYDIFDMSAQTLGRDTVTENGDITYDSKSGVYSFTVKFDPEKSTAKYKRVIAANLKKTNNNAGEVKFEEVALDVEMWSSGLIKKIKVNEKYNFKMMGMKMLNDYWANVYFSWDESRSGYVMDNYKDAFVSNYGINRNNSEYDNIGAKATMSFGAKIAAIVVPVVVVLIALIILIVVLVNKNKAKKAAFKAMQSDSISEDAGNNDSPADSADNNS